MLSLAGDIKAFEELVIRHQGAVLASAYTVVHNNYMAEDAAQDAFVSAWIKLNTLREPGKYGSWVCSIAKNCAKNLAVRFREYMDFDTVANYEYDHGLGTEELLISSEERLMLNDSIERLPKKVKQVIWLHYFEGLSIAEIADRLRFSVGTVKTQLHEERKKIRKELSAMNENENDTLVEKVMKKVEELKVWTLRNNKEGFIYIYNDVLADIDNLPESARKYHTLADVLMEGWWWLPGAKKDVLFARIKETAIKGKNDYIMKFIVAKEDGKLSGKDKMDFVLCSVSL